MIKLHNITLNNNLSTKHQHQKQYVINNSHTAKPHNYDNKTK